MKVLFISAVVVMGFFTIGMPIISAFLDKYPAKQELIMKWGIILQIASGTVAFWLAVIAAYLGAF